MSRCKFRSNALALLACSALLLASFGCSSNGTTTAPEAPSADVVENPNFVRILSTPGDASFSISAAPVSAVISAENGGTISNGRVTLDFPPYALSEDTEISIEMIDDGTLSVELSPHGIQFNRAVTLSMDLSGTSAEGQADAVSTLWFNEANNTYERMPMIDGDANHSYSQLQHFSKYHDGLGS